jgi:hypothetical protein
MSDITTDQIPTLLNELVARSDSLGLTWKLRPATIYPWSSAGGVFAVLDGDTAKIRVISLIGDLVEEQRVMIAVVPPSGNYVIGWVNGGPNSALDSWNTITAYTWYNATAEALVGPSVTGWLTSGCRYRIDVGCPVSSATSAHVARLQIRLTNIAGTIIETAQHYIPGNNYKEKIFFYGIYNATSTGNQEFVLTCQRAAGATSNIIVATATGYPLNMSLKFEASGPAKQTI